MRKVLWGDLLNVSGAYLLPLPMLVLHAVVSVLGVFAVSSLLDWLRIRYVEPRYMLWYDVNEEGLVRAYFRTMKVLRRFLHKLDKRLVSETD